MNRAKYRSYFESFRAEWLNSTLHLFLKERANENYLNLIIAENGDQIQNYHVFSHK